MKTRMNRLMIVCAVAGSILAVNVVTQAQDFTWTYKSPMPHGKGSGAAAAVGETIYVIGGHTEPWTYPYGRICEAYNTTTDTWTSKAILPHTNGRYALSAIAVNGKVYTFGGSNIGGNYNTNNIDEYNPITNTWIANKATLPISIAKVALAEYNGKIYVFGGGFYTAHDWWADNVYEYDPVANTVTAKATMPTKRGYAYAGNVGDKIYVIGGFGGYDAHDELTLVEAYDPATNLWTTGYAPMPTGGAIEGVVINDRIYVNVRNTTSVYEYSPTSNNWTSKSPMQTARSEPCIAAVDNRLYVMGGWSDGHITTSVEEGVLEQDETPADQIQEILEFVYESVTDGTLVGVGSGKSAENRMVAVMNMLEEVWVLIEAEWFAQACHQLRDVLKKCDGQSPPADLVSGSAVEELAGQINDLMDDICEETMFAPAEVMTWVPPYAIPQCKAAVQADFGKCDVKDGLTRVGLQFWVPRADGTIKYADHEWYTPNDADVAWWRNWCNSNGIECLLCVYNNTGSWDWILARSAFATNRTTFVNALVSEMDRLSLDGIDVDLEGLDPAILPSDRGAFDQFIHDLSVQVHTRGRILTIDTFSRTANGPNLDWWVDWVGNIDNIHSMGYDDLYEGGTDFQKYSVQQGIGYVSGYDRDVVLMGMPAWIFSWGMSSGRGTSAQAHVQEVHYDLPEPTGIAIWDLQLTAWQDSDLWCEIKDLKGDD